MNIGYARVSTDDQNPASQIDALKAAGCALVFTDKASGATAKRPQLAKCLKALGEGDTLVVWKLDRLGRSLHDLIGLLDGLNGRRVAFLSLTCRRLQSSEPVRAIIAFFLLELRDSIFWAVLTLLATETAGIALCSQSSRVCSH